MTRLFVVQHIDREGPDLFAKFACEHGIELIITRLDRGESLPTPTKRDGLLILGGPMGIGDIGDPPLSLAQARGVADTKCLGGSDSIDRSLPWGPTARACVRRRS